jgi:hypothetical protein
MPGSKKGDPKSQCYNENCSKYGRKKLNNKMFCVRHYRLFGQSDSEESHAPVVDEKEGWTVDGVNYFVPRKENGTRECLAPGCMKYARKKSDNGGMYCKFHWKEIHTPVYREPVEKSPFSPIPVKIEEGVQISPAFSYSKEHGQFYANSKPEVLVSQNLDSVETRGPSPKDTFSGYGQNIHIHITFANAK